MPKIGPRKSFKPILPNEVTEKLFNDSYATILIKYTEAAKKLQSKESTLKNINLDTGKEINYLAAFISKDPADKVAYFEKKKSQ